ncbi:hypothetical protein H0H87_011230 [Tephrocybe sp. NHM501043]|nr:hypothetical protein H0H87_011230 [Tephrocybe sp. NHM501043]
METVAPIYQTSANTPQDPEHPSGTSSIVEEAKAGFLSCDFLNLDKAYPMRIVLKPDNDVLPFTLPDAFVDKACVSPPYIIGYLLVLGLIYYWIIVSNPLATITPSVQFLRDEYYDAE